MVKDWRGVVVTEVESPDKNILVWEITPALAGRFDAVVIRDYSAMLEYVESHLPMLLDDKTEAELQGGVSVLFKLVSMTVERYDELQRIAAAT